MTVVLKLRRATTGQKILDAFRAAATFRISPDCKWEAHGYTTTSGTVSAGSTFSPCRGYRASPAYLYKQSKFSRLFRGHRAPKWHTSKGLGAEFQTQVFLQPLSPDKKYSEVQLKVHHEYSYGQYGCRSVDNPDDPAFAQFRPAYDRIVKDFIKRLR